VIDRLYSRSIIALRSSNPALVSAPSKKSFFSVSSPILACSYFTSMAGVVGAMLPVRKLRKRLPPTEPFCRNLIEVDVEMPRQLRYNSVAIDGGKRHLCLEGQGMVPARSSFLGLSCSRRLSPLSGRNSLSDLFSCNDSLDGCRRRTRADGIARGCPRD
jgi:hypothetical protein